MRFNSLDIEGAFEVHIERFSDDRGFFARTASVDEFAARGLKSQFSQSSISFNRVVGTLRGMHFSVGRHSETKLVRCTAGAVYDVLVDVRAGSKSFGRTLAFELSDTNRVALYVPAGVAHGFQTLRNETEVLYMIDEPYDASAARGFRWNDSIVETEWPHPISIISERDSIYPDFIARVGA